MTNKGALYEKKTKFTKAIYTVDLIYGFSTKKECDFLFSIAYQNFNMAAV